MTQDLRQSQQLLKQLADSASFELQRSERPSGKGNTKRPYAMTAVALFIAASVMLALGITNPFTDRETALSSRPNVMPTLQAAIANPFGQSSQSDQADEPNTVDSPETTDPTNKHKDHRPPMSELNGVELSKHLTSFQKELKDEDPKGIYSLAARLNKCSQNKMTSEIEKLQQMQASFEKSAPALKEEVRKIEQELRDSCNGLNGAQTALGEELMLKASQLGYTQATRELALAGIEHIQGLHQRYRENNPGLNSYETYQRETDQAIATLKTTALTGDFAAIRKLIEVYSSDSIIPSDKFEASKFRLLADADWNRPKDQFLTNELALEERTDFIERLRKETALEFERCCFAKSKYPPLELE